MTERQRLDELTDRWRRRHDARRPSIADRPSASEERESLTARAFPFRSVAPSDYVDAHGADMTAFTYDDERYVDPDLDAWIVEVGRLLRQDRDR